MARRDETGKGRIALVTGGGTGVGRGMAEALAAEGYVVVITGRRADVLEAAAADDVRALIGHTARFNWHGDLIRSAVRHPRIAVLLLRLLLR